MCGKVQSGTTWDDRARLVMAAKRCRSTWASDKDGWKGQCSESAEARIQMNLHENGAVSEETQARSHGRPRAK